MTSRFETALLAVLLPSCAATSGREWLEAPIEPRAAPVESGATFAGSDERVEARPRLRHTVTLGESYEAAAEAATPGATPAVQVTVNNHVPVFISQPVGYGYGYGYLPSPGYGYSHGRGTGAPVRGATAAPQKVGGDFPAPPDYGPRALR